MPAALSDAQLLRAFATGRDQRAFAELVARHQDMVFSTALRRTGRNDLAADVAQHVFLALATKAAWLTSRATIGGWLYKATLLETARRQRDEARRHARERRYAEEEMKLHPPSAGAAADDETARARALLPHLDDALSTLPAPDREAIVLRFLRGLSLRDTGAALGTTEEAARKRVSRALEKLSHAFHRRGLTTTAALLATTVLPRAVEAAPAELSASLAGIAAAAPTTGPAGWLYLQAAALNKAQIAAACALTAAVPMAWQAARIQELKNQQQTLLAATTQTPAAKNPAPLTPAGSPEKTPAAPAPPPANTRPAAPNRQNRGKWEEWRDLQRQQQRESRLAALQERLELDDTQLAIIAEATAKAESDSHTLHETARQTGTRPDPEQTAALLAQRDDTIAAALDAEQWTDYQAFLREEEAGRREIFANRLLADLQTTLHLSDSQKDALFSHFSTETTPQAPDSWRAPIEAMDNEKTEKLAEILSEEQFKLWRQRAEMWSHLFRRQSENTQPTR